MRDNGKEDAVGCEITRKRTLGKGGGGGGGRINDGGRSGGTLRYMYMWVEIFEFWSCLLRNISMRVLHDMYVLYMNRV